MRTAASALLLSTALLVCAAADEVRLVNGRVYSVAEWWVEGSELVMVTAEGLVRVPRAQVQRIVVEGLGDGGAETADYGRPAGLNALEAPLQAVGRRRLAVPVGIQPLIESGNIAAALAALEAAAVGEYADSVDYRLLKGALLLRAGLFGEAERALESALLAEPGDCGGLFLIGQAAYFQGRWQEALEHFRSSLEASGDQETRNRVLRRVDELERGLRGERGESDHFVIYAPSRMGGSGLIPALLELLERHLDEVAGALDYAPQRLLVVVSDYATGAGGAMEGTYDGKITLATGLLLSPRLEETAVHELAHAVLLPRTAGNCPLWLHEGLAQHLSGLRSAAYRGEIIDYLDDRLGALSLYPDSLTLVEYLLSRYPRHRLAAMLSLLEGGAFADEAAERAYDASLESLRAGRDRWLRERFDRRR